MMLFKAKKIEYNHYKTGDSIFVWNYNKVNETGDLRYCLKLSDYDELPNISDEQLHEIRQSFESINCEYLNRVGKRQGERNIFETNRSVEELECKYNVIKQYCFIIFLGGYDEESAKALKTYGYIINKETAKEDAERARKQAKRLVTDANVKRKILDELTDNKKTDVTLNDILYAINTKTGLHIDPRKTTLFDFLDIEDNFFKQLNNELTKERSGS